MRHLKGYPLVRRYLWGQSISILGDTALWLALGIWVRELTGSSAQAGLTFFFLAAPSLFGPVWGSVADRYPRRRVLLIGNIGSGLLTLALLGVHDRHQVWLIWAVMVGYGSSLSLLSAAQTGLLHTLLPEEHLGDAQGWLSTVREGLRLVAPLIGAGVFALVGGHAVALIDLSTFVVAAATLLSIRVEEPKPEPRPARWRDELAAGWVHIRTVRPLAQIVTALTVCCMVIGLTETAGFAVITTGLHLSAPWIGGWQMLMGVGALVGGPTVGRAMRRLGEGRVAALGMVAFAIAAGLEIVPNIVPVAAGALVAGFSLPWIIAASLTFMQRSTPSSLQGRVSSTVDVATSTPQSLSIAVGAALLAVLGYQVLMGVVAVVMFGADVWLVTRPEQRRRAATAAVEVPAELVGIAAEGVIP
jgi:predicted MFS family arabinose efflux permease